MRDINDLNLVGTVGGNRRVETKDGEAAQEIVVRYPRPSYNLEDEEKARFASLASKGLAHLGFESSDLNSFVQNLFSNATSEATETADDEDWDVDDSDVLGMVITINNTEYVLQPA